MKKVEGAQHIASLHRFGPSAFAPLKHVVQAADGFVKEYQKSLTREVPKIMLETMPEANNMKGERGCYKVTFMVQRIYQSGLHMHGPENSPLNSQVVPALRHVIGAVAGLPPANPQRVQVVQQLAEACMDCQQVQATVILRLYSDMTSQTLRFEDQLLYSLARQKERAVHELIGTLHAKTCDKDHTSVSPWQQRAHLFSGYVHLLGANLGMDGVLAAKNDRFAANAIKEAVTVCPWASTREELKERATEVLKSKMNVFEWMQALLADINNQKPHAMRLIDRGCIFKWADQHMPDEEEGGEEEGEGEGGEEEGEGEGEAGAKKRRRTTTKHDVFYSEDRADEFADFDVKRPTKDNEYEPFLSPRVLADMLCQANFLRRL